MEEPQFYVTNLELRESNPDGTEAAGLSHQAGGMFLLHVLELASAGEPRGGLTILHDAGDHGGRYRRAAERLAQDGWAIALPDLRGHGESEGARGHSHGLLEVVRDVQDVQDHLAYRLPDAPMVLVGQGLGALYALAFAIERPDQAAALVLLAPLLTPRFELPERKGGIAGLFKKVGPTSAGSIGIAPEDRTSDPDEQRAWRDDPLVHDVVTLQAGESIRAIAESHPPRASEVEFPILVLHGDEDTVVDRAASDRLRAPRLELRSVAGARHDLLHETSSEETLDTIRAFLRDAVAGTARE